MLKAVYGREISGRITKKCFTKVALKHAMETRDPDDYMLAFSLNREPLDAWVRSFAYSTLESFLQYRQRMTRMSPHWTTFLMQADCILTCLGWAVPDHDEAQIQIPLH